MYYSASMSLASASHAFQTILLFLAQEEVIALT